MLGTYLLVFVGPGSVIVASSLTLTPLEALSTVAAVFGCTVAAAILLLGRFSGAHINPAVTIANAAARRLKVGRLLPYVSFQLLGALLAGLSLRVVFGGGGLANALGSTRLAPGVSPAEGVVLEVLGTFLLATAALSAGSFMRRPLGQALLVGGTLFLLIMVIGPLTGASFNPARSLGPSLFSGYFGDQMVYYVGPVVGGALAGLAFRMHRKGVERDEDLDLVCVC